VSGCCAHSLCSTGFALDIASCSFGQTSGSCVENVCKQDAYCCSTDWDQICINHAKNPAICPASAPSGYGCNCAHDYCVTGQELSSACDPCVAAICDDDPYCCTTSWDTMCVQKVKQICNVPTGASCN
jgi:hypothetical protein